MGKNKIEIKSLKRRVTTLEKKSDKCSENNIKNKVAIKVFEIFKDTAEKTIDKMQLSINELQSIPNKRQEKIVYAVITAVVAFVMGFILK